MGGLFGGIGSVGCAIYLIFRCRRVLKAKKKGGNNKRGLTDRDSGSTRLSDSPEPMLFEYRLNTPPVPFIPMSEAEAGAAPGGPLCIENRCPHKKREAVPNAKPES